VYRCIRTFARGSPALGVLQYVTALGAGLRMLRLQLLGPIRLVRHATPVRLPASRKTRALLAYLAATRKPHRRDRLCGMFWSVPDDPRGALRWSLSKIRGLSEAGAPACLITDGDSVAVDQTALSVDISCVRQLLAAGIDRTETAVLLQAAEAFQDSFLADLDLPGCPEYQAWRVAMREDMRLLHAAILASLCERLPPNCAVPHARELVRINPAEEAAWATLVRLLHSAGRRQEGADQYEIACAALAREGGPSGSLTHAWREARRNRASLPADAARQA
jgi:DNA-binding SARP family transcriptional activator